MRLREPFFSAPGSDRSLSKRKRTEPCGAEGSHRVKLRQIRVQPRAVEKIRGQAAAMIGARAGGRTWPIMIFSMRPCRSGGMADAADSKSVARKGVWVRLPPPAPSGYTL